MLDSSAIKEAIAQSITAAEAAALAPDTYVQLVAAIAAFVIAWWLPSLIARIGAPDSAPQRIATRLRILLRPTFSALLMLIAAALSQALLGEDWLLRGAVMIAAVWLLESIIRLMQIGRLIAQVLRLIVLVFVALYLIGILTPVTAALESMSIEIGNLHFTLSGLLRVLVFGSLLFWLGWISNAAGQNAIRRQERLDLRTREVVAKLFQIGLSVLVLLLFLQVMGINLATLAVFGGAVGVGLGFGLQAIASNFISGIIILFDRSLSVGDYIEIEGGQSGHVRELTLRYTTLEGFDGKNTLVPNDSFITKPFTNWTHKNHKQRYRVDFSVAYHTDIRKLCEIIRAAVATHPQVISGDHIPLEERPDCEIDSFGDSGVKMFVEFWMDGIDDGPNRVGGDLLLLIFETLRENGIEIPFPQHEVRLLQNAAGARKAASDSLDPEKPAT